MLLHALVEWKTLYCILQKTGELMGIPLHQTAFIKIMLSVTFVTSHTYSLLNLNCLCKKKKKVMV